MTFPDADHPIWSLARQLILVITLGLFCVFNFDNTFDPEKDTRMMIGMAIIGLSSEALPKLLNKLKGHEDGSIRRSQRCNDSFGATTC